MANSQRVEPTVIRSIFNRAKLWEKAQKGELVAVVTSNRHPSKPKAPVPFCTKSQLVTYRDPTTKKKVAIVHQYLKPDGKLGASGKPDPKFVFHEGVRYHTL